MSSMPNVSAIYRDLSHLHQNVQGGNSVSPHTPFTNNYSLQSRGNTSKNGFQQLYSYKQQRHNELMKKLKNSYEENKNLLSTGGPSMHSHYMQKNFYNPPPVYEAKTQNSKFVMPKIRYRHIQDKQKPSEKEISHKILESTLQRQFYGDNSKNVSRTDGFQQKENKNVEEGMQTQVKPKFMQNQLKDDEIGSEISFKSDRHGRAKLQSKYEDNLASYYELCRKNIHSSNIKEKTSTKEQKFTRNDGKTKKLRVDQALKILSLE